MSQSPQHNPEVTRALEAHGFQLTHQGGGLHNYQRDTSDGFLEIVCASCDGQAPTQYSEPVDLYRFTSTESPEAPQCSMPLSELLAVLK